MPDKVENDVDRIIELRIGFNLNNEEIEYIKSGFFNDKFAFKDPVSYTISLMEMALDKYIGENGGFGCPKCDEEFVEGWKFCPNCGICDRTGEIFGNGCIRGKITVSEIAHFIKQAQDCFLVVAVFRLSIVAAFFLIAVDLHTKQE